MERLGFKYIADRDETKPYYALLRIEGDVYEDIWINKETREPFSREYFEPFRTNICTPIRIWRREKGETVFVDKVTNYSRHHIGESTIFDVYQPYEVNKQIRIDNVNRSNNKGIYFFPTYEQALLYSFVRMMKKRPKEIQEMFIQRLKAKGGKQNEQQN